MHESIHFVIRQGQVGFIFQFFNLLPTLTAAENVTLPLPAGKLVTLVLIVGGMTNGIVR